MYLSSESSDVVCSKCFCSLISGLLLPNTSSRKKREECLYCILWSVLHQILHPAPHCLLIQGRIKQAGLMARNIESGTGSCWCVLRDSQPVSREAPSTGELVSGARAGLVLVMFTLCFIPSTSYSGRGPTTNLMIVTFKSHYFKQKICISAT